MAGGGAGGAPQQGGYPGQQQQQMQGYPGSAGGYSQPQGFAPPPPAMYAPPTGAPPGAYAPPPGPPPSGSGMYRPPSGPPPPGSGMYQPPAGPPPGGMYAPPPGAPPPGGAAGGGMYHPPTGPPPPSGAMGYAQAGSHYTAGTTPTSLFRMRRALFIGINYIGTQNELKGCHMDVKNMSNFVRQRYPYMTEITILTDERGTSPSHIPTRQNILNAMRWLVAGAQPGDHFFFHYSGHGGQQADETGDEADGMDETLIPLDFQQTGQIIDDDLHSIMCAPLPQGSFLTAVFDCCHSGTIMDLPYTYKLDQNDHVVEINNMERAGKSLLAGAVSWMRGDKMGAMAAAKDGLQALMMGLKEGQQGGGQQQQQGGQQGLSAQTRVLKVTRATVIQWSGCRDDQTSADTRINGMPTGAMSWALIKAMQQHTSGQSTYLDVLKTVRGLLAQQYTQVAQLSCGYQMNLNIPMAF